MRSPFAAMLLLPMAIVLVLGCGDPRPSSASPPDASPSSGSTSGLPGTHEASPSAGTGSPAPSTLTTPPVATPVASRAPTATAAPSPRPTEPPAISEFPQAWAGTWTDPETGAGGSLELALTGRGADFGGSITMDGTACFASGVLRGSYDGRDLQATVSQRDVEIVFDGLASAGAISGTFSTACDGMDGTWEVTRTER